MRQKIESFVDFSGGYSSVLPPERMPDNMLRDCFNVYWDGELVARTDTESISTSGESGNWLGGIRGVLNSISQTIICTDSVGGGSSTFYRESAPNTFVEIGAVSWVNAGYVLFEQLDDHIIAVDTEGNYQPVVIYYDSGYVIVSLDEFDARTQDNSDWYAGAYVFDGTYTDDTADIQDPATVFTVVTGAADGDGFFIASALPFNKVTIKDLDQFDGSPVASIQYYADGNVWTAVSGLSEPTWTGAAGDKDLTFTLPEDWIKLRDGWDDPSAQDPTAFPEMIGKFVLSVRFTTAPTTDQGCSELIMYNTSYATTQFGGDTPRWVAIHNSYCYLAVGNNAYRSYYAEFKGWEIYRAEPFPKGGDRILCLLPYKEGLYIFKERYIGGIFGTSDANITVDDVDTIGTKHPFTPVVVGERALFYDSDGYVRIFDGRDTLRISKHIHDDIENLVDEDEDALFGYEWQGRYWLTTGSDEGINTDPDTFRRDDVGDGLTAWFKADLHYGPRIKDLDFFYVCRVGKYNNWMTTYPNTDAFIRTNEHDYGARGHTKVFVRGKVNVAFGTGYELTFEVDRGQASGTIAISQNIYFDGDQFNGNPSIFNISPYLVQQVQIGAAITGSGVPAETIVISKTGPETIVASKNMTQTAVDVEITHTDVSSLEEFTFPYTAVGQRMSLKLSGKPAGLFLRAITIEAKIRRF